MGEGLDLVGSGMRRKTNSLHLVYVWGDQGARDLTGSVPEWDARLNFYIWYRSRVINGQGTWLGRFLNGTRNQLLTFLNAFFSHADFYSRSILLTRRRPDFLHADFLHAEFYTRPNLFTRMNLNKLHAVFYTRTFTRKIVPRKNFTRKRNKKKLHGKQKNENFDHVKIF